VFIAFGENDFRLIWEGALQIGDPVYALQQADLEVRIKELLTAANAADADLARAITTAGDDAAGQPETRPDRLSH
jgi:hypothetical protein